MLTIGRQIAEALELHRGMAQGARPASAPSSCWSWSASPAPPTRVDDYPHQFSGGMRQRVMIAMALACEPKLLIADEPTTALDVTIQAQILELIQRLRTELGMAVIMITHDLGVVAGIADRVNVMYAGYIVETRQSRTMFARPAAPVHAGPAALDPAPRPVRGERAAGRSRACRPTWSTRRPGCPFEPRCPYSVHQSTCENPPLELKAPDHWRRAGSTSRTAPRHDRARPARRRAYGRGEPPRDGYAAASPRNAPSAATAGGRDDLVEVEHLKMYFPVRRGVLQRQVGWVKAVDDISFDVQRGETLGLVGESGCGKTHHRPRDPAALQADRGPRPLRGRGSRPSSAAASCAGCAARCR